MRRHRGIRAGMAHDQAHLSSSALQAGCRGFESLSAHARWPSDRGRGDDLDLPDHEAEPLGPPAHRHEVARGAAVGWRPIRAPQVGRVPASASLAGSTRDDAGCGCEPPSRVSFVSPIPDYRIGDRVVVTLPVAVTGFGSLVRLTLLTRSGDTLRSRPGLLVVDVVLVLVVTGFVGLVAHDLEVAVELHVDL